MSGAPTGRAHATRGAQRPTLASSMSLPGSAFPRRPQHLLLFRRFPARSHLPGFGARVRRLFGPALNPLKHLGALGVHAVWLLVVSGTVLYIVLDTSAAGAYRSIEALTKVP